MNSSLRIFLGFSIFLLDAEIRLLAGASATGAATLTVVLAVTLLWRAGFRSALTDFLGEASFFNGGLLIFGGDECEEGR